MHRAASSFLLAVPTGAIQVPPTGQPILLMNDHATTGGYAIAGAVITADLPLPGSLRLVIGLNSRRARSRRRTRSCADGRPRLTQSSGAFQEQMVARFGAERVRAEEPLAPYTTFKVGGPAEWFLEARTSDEIVDALRVANASGVAVTLLGGGSNVLIGDRGVRGLVVRPRGGSHRADRQRAASALTRPLRSTASCDGPYRGVSQGSKRGLAHLEPWEAPFSAMRTSGAG